MNLNLYGVARSLPDAWQGAITGRVFCPYGDILYWPRQNVRGLA